MRRRTFLLLGLGCTGAAAWATAEQWLAAAEAAPIQTDAMRLVPTLPAWLAVTPPAPGPWALRTRLVGPDGEIVGSWQSLRLLARAAKSPPAGIGDQATSSAGAETATVAILVPAPTRADSIGAHLVFVELGQGDAVFASALLGGYELRDDGFSA